jgi:hypothetical protein
MLRLAAFLGVLVVMAGWGLAAPRKRQDIPRVIRWTNNFALVVVDTHHLFQVVLVGFANGMMRQVISVLAQTEIDAVVGTFLLLKACVAASGSAKAI